MYVTNPLLNKLIGSKLRRHRTEIGISQEAAALHIGVTFQQLQKYEKATNRIPIERLLPLLELYSIPVAEFFGDLSSTKDQAPAEEALMKECRNMSGKFRLLDANTRAAIIGLVTGLARAPEVTEKAA